jgi:hypothetical protein
MALSITEKGKRIVKLIKSVRVAGALVPGDKVRMPGERPAAYIRPSTVEDGIQMHAFRLFDGMEVIMEVPALNPEPGQAALLATREAAGQASH